MARTFMITDDLDGTANAETVEFSVRGQRYEIDLSSKNQQKFDAALAEWVGHARKVGGAGRPRGSGGGGQKPRRDKAQVDAIRQWARANGWPDLGDRGRIPYAAEEAYNKAQGS